MDHIEYLGVAEAAELAGVHENTVRYWVLTRKLRPDATICKAIGFTRPTMEAFIAQRDATVSSALLDGEPAGSEAVA